MLQIRARTLSSPDDPMLQMQMEQLKNMAKLQFEMDILVERKEVRICLFCTCDRQHSLHFDAWL